MAEFSVIFPFMNAKFISFKGPQWYLNDEVCVRSLADEDFGAIQRGTDPEIKNLVPSGSKCVLWECGQEVPNNQVIERRLSAIKFALNSFIDEGAVHIPFGVIIKRARNRTVHGVIEFSYFGISARLSGHSAKIRAKTEPVLIKETFKLADIALQKNPACLLMLKRYNMSRLRGDPADELIDIAIALEYVVKSNTELTFRLCSIIALCVEGDPKSRHKIFELFSKFYNARSNVVHGASDSSDPKIAKIYESLGEIRKYCALVMVYYFKFLETNDAKEWAFIPLQQVCIVRHYPL